MLLATSDRDHLPNGCQSVDDQRIRLIPPAPVAQLPKRPESPCVGYARVIDDDGMLLAARDQMEFPLAEGGKPHWVHSGPSIRQAALEPIV